MNQSKFSLADLLTVLAAIVFGFVCFLSFNFASLGADKYKSIMYAALIAIGMGGLALAAAMLKRTRMISKTKVIMEFVLMGVFLIAAVVATIPFSHFFTVSDQKEEIEEISLKNIGKGIEMYDAYRDYAEQRMQNYLDELQTARNNRNDPEIYNKYFYGIAPTNNTSIERQIDNKMEELASQLDVKKTNTEPYGRIKVFSDLTIELDSIFNNNVEWLKNDSVIVKNWKPISIAEAIGTIEKTINEYKDDLVKKSKERCEYEYREFSHEVSFGEVKDKFEKWEPKVNLISVLLAVLLYVVMWLSYIVTRRDSRWPGYSIVFGADKQLDNEL